MKKVIAGIMIAVGMVIQLSAVMRGNFYVGMTTTDTSLALVGLALEGSGVIISDMEEEKEE